MIRFLGAGTWLVLLWVVLWRDLSVANVASGVLVAVVLLALFPFGPSSSRIRLRPVPLLRLLLAFAWSVIRANLTVAWEVVTPGSRVREGIVAVPLQGSDPVVTTLVSHAITLAPGTMVIDVVGDELPVLLVHVLHLRSPEVVRREVQHLERLALAALGGRAPTGATDPGNRLPRVEGGHR